MSRTSLLGVVKNGLKLWKIYSEAINILDKEGGKKMWNFIFKRLSEASTWRGLVLLLTSLGATLNPEQTAAIVTAGLAFAGIIGAFFPDKP